MYFSSQIVAKCLLLVYNWLQYQVHVNIVVDGSRVLGSSDSSTNGCNSGWYLPIRRSAGCFRCWNK
ncbi:hypothetical protein BDF20DRAFT_858157 [Mycotypha africana]|uniref:uncharacterized protein n=1 Tax=Mycotypha africana TaxID=64632 RepID=UPI0023010AC4|nr:uncharacterized protein BDF20DRAFT_858157 [Mycotypha africana]KAI8984126.1 hypothetical protein BDF20DRAFT_858157 [Mycotypha africana]